MTALDQFKHVAERERPSGSRAVVAIWVDWREYREWAWSFSDLLVGVQGGRNEIAAKLNASWESEGLLALVLRTSDQVKDACVEIERSRREAAESLSALQRLLDDGEKPIGLLVLANHSFPADGTSPDYEMPLSGGGVQLKVVDHGRVLSARLAELAEYDRNLQKHLGLLQYYLRQRWPGEESKKQLEWSERLFSALNLNPNDSRTLAGLQKKKTDLSDEEREEVIGRLRQTCGRKVSTDPVRVGPDGTHLVNWISHAAASGRGFQFAQALRDTYGQTGLASSTGSSLSTLLMSDLDREQRKALKSDGVLWTAYQTVLLVGFVYRWGNISAHKDDYEVRVPMATLVGLLLHEVEHARRIVDCWKR